jgi:hypothetical protein
MSAETDVSGGREQNGLTKVIPHAVERLTSYRFRHLQTFEDADPSALAATESLGSLPLQQYHLLFKHACSYAWHEA